MGLQLGTKLFIACSVRRRFSDSCYPDDTDKRLFNLNGKRITSLQADIENTKTDFIKPQQNHYDNRSQQQSNRGNITLG